MKYGIALGALNVRSHLDATLEAERLGYESVWLPEHLVFTRTMTSSPHPGEDIPPVPPDLPIFDAFAYLGYLAGRTERIRLGTHVYNLGLRHPFTSARGALTVDYLSGGRFEFGIGASWLAQEWEAAELDFSTRGRRVDEAMAICRRLWTEDTVTHHGEFFSFAEVVFQPKPVQPGGPPILVGGESEAALRRAARLGDGWLGMGHTLASAEPQITRLFARLDEAGRSRDGFQVVLGGPVADDADARRWADLGVTRLIVSPWTSSREAVAGLRRFADAVTLG